MVTQTAARLVLAPPAPDHGRVEDALIAQRRFRPADYLRPGTNTETGLAADVFLPVLLELGDPGTQAVGFEIRFL